MPIGEGNSPYSSTSAFGAEELYINAEILAEDNFIGSGEAGSVVALTPANVAQYGAARRLKQPLFKMAFKNFLSGLGSARGAGFESFSRENAYWLDDFALFTALKDKLNQTPWMLWKKPLRLRQDGALNKIRGQLKEEILYHKFVQFLFERQWRKFRNHALVQGIGLIGDVSFYVAQDSADAWAHREIFQIDESGNPKAVAGTPPDAFNKNGQIWGNPPFNWKNLKRARYDWWIKRLRKASERFDALRLDHFIGFHNYWEIPAGSKTAASGKWVLGPGEDFFREVFARLPDIQLIAEDLGVRTPEVEALRDKFDLPGMRVLQFVLEEVLAQGKIKNLSGRKRQVVYTGTHDNDTALGWWRTRVKPMARNRREGALLAKIFPSGADSIHWNMIRLAFNSKSDTAIIPIQDALGLDSKSRINTPGTKENNWIWRLEEGQLGLKISSKLADLTRASKRS